MMHFRYIRSGLVRMDPRTKISGFSRERSHFSSLEIVPNIMDISQVKFAHDPVPILPSFLNAKDAPFPGVNDHTRLQLKKHGIRLHPRKARLPYRSTLDAVHETRYWKQGLEASRKLLQLLADDHSTTDVVVGRGVTLANLAQQELRSEFEHRFCKANLYMFPFADEERTKLLAASMVMMFLFDDKGEEASDSALNNFVEDFVDRVNNFQEHSVSDSRLQRHTDSVMLGFRNADLIAGNGGKEVIGAMSKSFRRMRPEMQFRDLGQYLEFRHDNVSADYVLAAVKFSLGSRVNLSEPRLNRYLTLVKDHLSIVNDMASYDKEKRDFDSGTSKDMINIVDVIQKTMSLPDTDSAKAMAYTYQLQTEAWMVDELQRLDREEQLDLEQWQYLEATYVCAAGNVYFSMTSSRYGGEAARLQPSNNYNESLATNIAKKRALDVLIEGRPGKLARAQ